MFPAMTSIQRAAPTLSATVTSQVIKARQKVILEPGHSALDWARFTQEFEASLFFLSFRNTDLQFEGSWKERKIHARGGKTA